MTMGIAMASACSLPNCFNPGYKPPRKNQTQLVWFSHDDAITDTTRKFVDQIDRQGVPMTFFVTWQDTVCDNVKYFFDKGDEIGMHTMTHPHLPTLTKDKMKYELLTIRDKLNTECGIPRDKIVGARSPYLEANSNVYDILYADKETKWDSTFGEYGGTPYSKGRSNRMYPFTMDSGVYEDPKGDGKSYPGFWEIPLNNYFSDIKSVKSLGAMDPGRIQWSDGPTAFTSGENMYEILVNNFHDVYDGNRAPFSIAIHTPWLEAKDYTTYLSKFFDYLRELPDVEFVTMSEVIEYIQHQ